MKYSVIILLFSSLSVFFVNCNTRSDEKENYKVGETKETLRNINKALVDKDREAIEAYIQRHRLDGMVDNGSGLFYLIWGDSIGPKADEGCIVFLDYSVKLLDGTECYSSKGLKPKEFMVGMGGVEAGLEMGVRMMRMGQKAKFILPPHLAHGLIGDNNKIPPRSIIVYDVHLLKVLDK